MKDALTDVILPLLSLAGDMGQADLKLGALLEKKNIECQIKNTDDTNKVGVQMLVRQHPVEASHLYPLNQNQKGIE